ncbi:hypothetical protein Ga0466249_003429 [Sporomusaceae bacterium BoRhaA]|uniref:hypothetical protein n=1 Tax=Pelorhabdus rhamnosifermentans TaxID=2772457 RepID=UPI001C062A42|nr:hypothetical protein [Pelorhabdus rhamnosifermentans]MBU2702302.1 hypothetical protein [Pelorhabdus rhamnosifermentans]
MDTVVAAAVTNPYLAEGEVVMHHKFDVKSFAKLDNPERRKSLPADEILHKFDLENGDVVADVG